MSEHNQESKAEIYTALIKAQSVAQAVEKGSSNAFHKYKYASAESMIGEAREALSAAGLALMTVHWFIREERMNVGYALVHGSGQMLEFQTSTAIIPDKGRPMDKAEATALTYNLGYFLRGLLLLPRVEPGTQPDERDDRDHDPIATLTKEYDRLLGILPEGHRHIVEMGMQKKGVSRASYTAANKYMQDVMQDHDKYSGCYTNHDNEAKNI